MPVLEKIIIIILVITKNPLGLLADRIAEVVHGVVIFKSNFSGL